MTKSPQFSVEDTFWGYQIQSGRAPAMGLVVAQSFSYFFGACFMIAAVSIVGAPILFFGEGVGVMRVVASVLFAAAAFYLLWFASRGSQTEIHVDTSVGEIRQVIINRAGKPTTVGAYGFETIGGVHIIDGLDPMSLLVLQYRDTEKQVSVAEGLEAQLIPLRDRLAQDLMVGAAVAV
ncbi:hypothetical protein DS901_08125 [Loktanella sp. D2R18]|uniref:hypothetical protein n=1 Tax=Rhodobacterales TaxID=204455 RepID=UPI000DE90F76|nr:MULTISPECIES: hypothetical protein [Rhodobacterales]MDO6589737.1 hypothetical protein [Yoonia sp. 1_MG-2023]RBW44363.1 hypothetical protein DS901_08125 [Loktanella sp. D2R18]